MSKFAFTCGLICLLAASAAQAFGTHTVFTIPLPTNHTSGYSAAVDGDMYYTAEANGNLYAVNLTSKSIDWTVTLAGLDIGSVQVAGDMVLIGGQGIDTFSFNKMTGALNWVTSDIALSAQKKNTVVAGDYIWSLQESYGELSAVNKANGVVANANVFPAQTTKFIFRDGKGYGNLGTVATVTDLATTTTLFTFANSINVIGVSEKYVVVTVSVGTEENPKTIFQVYDTATNMFIKNITDNVEGADSYNGATFVDADVLVYSHGEFIQKLAILNVSSGMLKGDITIGQNSGFGGGAVVGQAPGVYVTLTEGENSASLLIINTTSGSLAGSAKHVPFPENLGGKLPIFGKFIVIPNPQGYVVFDTAGNYVSRNEHDPGFTVSETKYMGDYIKRDTTGIVVYTITE